MCGIFGYNGGKEASSILLGGLYRLEYRGYDSAGVAILSETGVHRSRVAGRVEALEAHLKTHPLPPAGVGIAHTRWATHGAPTERNAHPHVSGRVTVVHNGILENYDRLKQELEAAGRVLESETDTEVIAHLLDLAYTGDPIDAIRQVSERLQGSYALALLFADHPDRVYAVRVGSPLLVGYGDGESFLASDRTALLPHTRRYTPLGEGEMAILARDGISLFDRAGQPIQREPLIATEGADAVEKGPYPHFMAKEMDELPTAVRQTLAAYLHGARPFEGQLPDGRQVKELVLLGCGSAMHACLCGQRMLERWARIPTRVYVASEFRYCDPLLSEGTWAVAVSQSGETADTLAALRLCKERGIPTVGVVNVATSSLSTLADQVLYTRAGPEIAVATTKAYGAQVALLGLMAYRFARDRGCLAEDAPFSALPEALEQVTATDGACAEIGQRLAGCPNVFFIGRGRDYPVCVEGALKLKEISYLHSEAYAAGELKHGTIALLHSGVPVVALITDPCLRDKTVSNLKECRARGAEVILLCGEDVGEVPADAYDSRLTLPGGMGELSVLPAAAALQRIAYHAACYMGRDVDKPRNLAKSVTVE
ncbi:MAG: glutamine--fructose-6-phosphate transaminase (isomerizing) [Clostridia bacterium]|nr:glutamine--fructose-6-phosphate transaminase (isomerizing) [Clostridia bacterium]